MQFIKTAIKWIYGIGFPIFGLQLLFTKSFLGGLFLILCGLFLLPFTLKLFEKKIGRPLTKFQRRSAILGSLFAASFFIMISGISNYHHENISNSTYQPTVSNSHDDNNVNQNNESNRVIPSSNNLQYIPGLSAVDIYGNLTNKGFTMSKQIGETLTYWWCKKGTSTESYTVVICGADAMKIIYVEATYLNYTNGNTSELAKDFLGYVASTPYDGALQQEAKDWTKKMVGKKAETNFGGVRFETLPSGRSRMMSFGVDDK